MTELICIDNKYSQIHGDDVELTIGKKYLGGHSAIDPEKYYAVTNDNGNIGDYMKYRFITVQEMRIKQLNELDI